MKLLSLIVMYEFFCLFHALLCLPSVVLRPAQVREPMRKVSLAIDVIAELRHRLVEYFGREGFLIYL